MKESMYSPKFEEAVKHAGDTGVSAGDLYEQVGSSRQAVYAWIKKNQSHLRAVGESPRGGVLYKWIERTPAERRGVRAANGQLADAGEGVEVGSVFTVTRLRFVAGKMVATLSGPNTEVEAELS